MVFDPRPGQAQAAVAAMLDALEQEKDVKVEACHDSDWAVAAVAPPVETRTSGANIHDDVQGTIVWTGEVFLPEDWTREVSADTSQEDISRALLGKLTDRGIDALAEVDGTFCGAWYDRRADRWHIFNDRIGFIPVFWARNGDRLVIGPKAWAVWQALGTPLAINDPGVIDLIRAQNVVNDHTLIEDVHWLIGGHAVVRDAAGVRTQRYWEFRHLPIVTENEDELIDSYVDACRRVMQRYTESENPLLLGLSGGMDSRMILAACHEIGRVPACFSTGWPFSEDVRFGRALAKAAGASHEVVPLESDGLPDRLMDLVVEADGLHSVAHMIFGSAMAPYLQTHRGSVLLEGMVYGVAGGGCVAEDDDVPTAEKPPHACRWALKNLHGGGSFEMINDLLRDGYGMESYRRWQQQVDDRYHSAPSDDPLQQAEYTTQSGRAGRNNVLGALPLRRDTLMRHPLCDLLMERWFASAPPRPRRGKRLYMDILRHRFPRFARVQRTNYNGLPIAEDHWLREYCWQKEKVHRWWVRRRHPRARRWGLDGQAVRAWGFDIWRRSGALDVLIAPDARVLNWVKRDRLLALWNRAITNPLESVPVLTLATIELMIRWLEALPQQCETNIQSIQMNRVQTGTPVGAL
jgi:hypothetical protein